MRQFLPSLRLVGADALRDGALQARSVAIEGGRIAKGPFPEVDVSGYLVLPGIVDLERPVDAVPRPASCAGAPTWDDVEVHTGIDGVTTAMVRQNWNWASGIDDREAALSSLSALRKWRRGTGTDLRIQLHVETHLMDWEAAVHEHADGETVSQVIFRNRLGQAMAEATFQRDARQAHLRALSKRSQDVPRFLCRLAENFDRVGVLYGSQGDPDGETREFFSMIGGRICLRPATRAAAALARAVGDPVLLSASDILQPSDASADFSAERFVTTYKNSALVSQGRPGCLVQAAFHLVGKGGMTLADAWSLVSTRPAEIARLPDRGRIAYGQRADLVIVHPHTRKVHATLAGGCLTYATDELAARFADLPSVFEHAAE
ncbi:amidohydrolase family protein [Tropicimonas sp. S265A]|uniref:amidohydrolase family protein n=1 Tax=Tropicimonas sp. S265A TaxID=3415134 RepID=UPI003C7DDA1D